MDNFTIFSLPTLYFSVFLGDDYREENSPYYPHNNKLEVAWTIVPAIALAFIVIYGLMTWNKIMYNQEKGEVVEVYAYQFGWIVRYSGVDNILGKAIIKWFLLPILSYNRQDH